MSRYAKDPELNLLANELKTLHFSAAPDLESDARERYEILARQQGDYPFRLVYQMPNVRTWVVRLYLGGAIRTIGYTDNLTNACRFSDMAALRFWKYRIRGACEPLDVNLNFGVDQAKHDSLHETDAADLLDKIENYLRINYLGDPKQIAEERETRKYARDSRRTVRHDFHELIGQLSEKLDRIEAKIDQMDTPVWKPQPGKVFSDPNPNWVESALPRLRKVTIVNPDELFSSPIDIPPKP